MKDEDLWLQFVIEVPAVERAPVTLCGLCGNLGIVRTTWKWDGGIWRATAPCICPNGRAMVAHGRISDRVLFWREGDDLLTQRFLETKR